VVVGWAWGQAWLGLSSFRRWVWCHGSTGAHSDSVTLRPTSSQQWRYAPQIPFLSSYTKGIFWGVKLDTEEENLCLCEGVGTKQSLIMDNNLKVKMDLNSSPSATYCPQLVSYLVLCF
jgi:hypothetical protein